MPTTRKKVIKTVYKDDDSEEEGGDFSDSGSDAKISDAGSSSDEAHISSGDEFANKKSSKSARRKTQGITRKPMIMNVKTIVQKINKQMPIEHENIEDQPPHFSVKDLSEADKLLPPILNLSESDSSDDESPKPSTTRSFLPTATLPTIKDLDSEDEAGTEYKDVWSSNMQDNTSEEIAKKAFMELEQHKSKIEEAKASVQNYTMKMASSGEADVKDLLALGEEALPEEEIVQKKKKIKKKRNDSDSEIEDWEEVAESKASIPQQGIQLFVEFPDAGCRKKKKIDVEMMMKRKLNRVKKEYQVYMHKVHVLCWLGHGNFVSCVLNDQEIMAAALSLVPSKECYPGERVDMKYVEQVTMWYKDKLTLKQDKHEGKFRPKAPPLKNILLEQIKSRVVTTKKYSVFIFVSMLRALGLQCRVMFNFVTLPIKPPSLELCSLSLKDKDEKKVKSEKTDKPGNKKKAVPNKANTSKLHQVDGHFDSDTSGYTSNSESDIVQLDGNNDNDVTGTRKTRSTKRNNAAGGDTDSKEDVLPSKIARKNTSGKSPNPSDKDIKPTVRRTQRNKNIDEVHAAGNTVTENIDDSKINLKKSRKSPAPKTSEIVNKSKSLENPKSNQRKRNTVTNKTENEPTKETLLDVKEIKNEDVSPPKISRKSRKSPAPTQKQCKTEDIETIPKNKKSEETSVKEAKKESDKNVSVIKSPSTTLKNKPKTLKSNTRNKNVVSKDPQSDVEAKVTTDKDVKNVDVKTKSRVAKDKAVPDNATPQITVTNQDNETSKFFSSSNISTEKPANKLRLSRNRSATTNPNAISTGNTDKVNSVPKPKRTKSAPGKVEEKSKYFNNTTPKRLSRTIKDNEDSDRVSHRDLPKAKIKAPNNVTDDLVGIIKKRIRNAKEESKQGIVKGKIKKESDEDSDYLPVEDVKHQSGSDDDFKPTKISPKPSTSRKIDRRVLSSEDETKSRKIAVDVWCEIFVEELEQWVSVDVIKGKMHDVNTLYANATHPVCYIVGWDNNNYLKDLTRKYVPHWNTVTRKQRVEPVWWDTAMKPWRGPRTAKDKEEDEYLDRMQLEAPLPKVISEYKNHPLYALQRHLLKYEAIYPPDAAVLGYIRKEAVYARECIYVCRSRDTWLKEAKVVKLGEKPYKIVKARPKWDKLSNKMITDKPLEVFGPWQVQDYEPPVAENGMVPRNAYGNVELFKECMLPKGTVHLKLPSLNRVAKKLNIDCAPAMTGFDFNGGWSHPVYDGFVVCKEFEEIITDAWVKDQEEQERREREKIETRVYGNWKRLIKGLLIKERLKDKYGFEEPAPSSKSKTKGPKLVVKKKM